MPSTCCQLAMVMEGGPPSAAFSALYSLYLSLLLLPALFVCLILPLVLLRRASSSPLHRRNNLPPGPRALPLIGHLHLLGSNPHHSLSLLSQSHGPLMFLRFGSIPVLVASSPAMAREVLQAHDPTFCFRFQPAVPTQLVGCTDIVFSQPGPYWKLMRQICLTDLFGRKRLKSFRPIISEEVRELLRSILDTTDEVLPVRAKLYKATNDIISRIAVSERLADLGLPSQADPSYNIVNLLVDAIHLTGVFNVGDFIPSLAWMDLQGCVRQSKAVGERLQRVWQEVIDGRRERRRQRDSIARLDIDFLDVLITASDQHKDIGITDFNIMSILTDMFAGGTDTSSISIEWALGELLSHPMKMKKAQDELEQVVGMSRLVQQTDIPHLPYLCAVVKEAMRLHPVLPLLVPHKASQECQVSGYYIPKDTMAYVNVWGIGRDPSIWERPLEFWPERFLQSNTDVHGHHFELLPFGSGRRACPGLALGLGHVQIMLASLLHCFDWSSVEKPDMAEKFGVVMTMEKPLVARAIPRVNCMLLAK